MHILIKLMAGLVVVALSTNHAAAKQCSAQSGPHTTSLLELYTSEGCSSCPPADEWISKIKLDKADVTPLAFHVDYWDYIGWTDLFAKPEYAQRQRQNSALGGSRFVYTPQFILNGKDYRQWHARSLDKQTDGVKRKPAQAALTLNLDQDQKSWRLEAQATLNGQLAADNMHVYVALYQNGLQSVVNAGENRGRTLKHDYVVRKLFGGYTLNDKSMFSKAFTLGSKWNGRDAGAVVFMQDKTTGAIIQSLALPFCES